MSPRRCSSLDHDLLNRFWAGTDVLSALATQEQNLHVVSCVDHTCSNESNISRCHPSLNQTITLEQVLSSLGGLEPSLLYHERIDWLSSKLRDEQMVKSLGKCRTSPRTCSQRADKDGEQTPDRREDVGSVF